MNKVLQKVGQAGLMTITGYEIGKSVNSNKDTEIQHSDTREVPQVTQVHDRMSDEKILLIVIIALLVVFALAAVRVMRKRKSERLV